MEMDYNKQKEKHDRIIVNVEKGQKAVIKEEAKKRGYPSLNSFVISVIQDKMKEE